MDAVTRIEQALERAIAAGEHDAGPPLLAQAIRHAVFPRGSRLRPQLSLAVAAACGMDDPAIAEASACAIELLHCASLVHDDLPCFDDAPTRRGRPSVHAAYGEPLAVLAGDALIVLAFQTLAVGAVARPQRLALLVTVVAGSVGAPFGIVAGQAWECEPDAVLATYQRAKTGALFAGATMAGAAAAGAAPGPWRALGEHLGEAYQVIDDIRDVAGRPDEIGKPVGRDAALARPNAALQLGLAGAMARLDDLVRAIDQSVPPCQGAPMLRAMIGREIARLVPAGLAQRAA